MVIKARNFLNREGLITVYYSFIYPYLIYCNHIWGCTYKTHLQRLVILQNMIGRIISQAKARESSQPLHRQLGIIKFMDLNGYLIARFMFQYATARVSDSFTSLFHRNNEYHNHETRTSDLGKTGIIHRGAIIWNAVLSNNISTDVPEAVYVKLLRRLINENALPWIGCRVTPQTCICIIYWCYVEQLCLSHNEK